MKSFLMLILLIPNLCFGSTQLMLETKLGQIEFLAVGNPGFIKIKGKGEGPSGTLTVENNRINGSIALDLASLDTGMSLRNEHMKDKYLQTKEFPKATLTIKNQEITKNWSLNNPAIKEQKITGILNIHGQENPVLILYSFNEKAKLTAEFDVIITDFKIDLPSFMGVTVAEKVTVNLESTIKEVK